MGKKFYRFIRPFLRWYLPKLEVVWETPPETEPCVFVCNHDRAQGPLQMAINAPFREQSKIWIFADALDRKSVPAWVRQDNWWNPDSRLAPVYNAVIPPVISVILPPILRSVPYIPVYHDGRAVKTMKDSLRALRDEKMNIVLFPEIPTGVGEHDTEKINEGFLNILPMYQKLTGKELVIRPIRLDPEKKIMRIGQPIHYDTASALPEQIPSLSKQILDGMFS